MKMLNIGNDITASAIVLGCMRISDKSKSEVEKLILTAVDCNINYFDHADIYGRGVCEEKFGEFLSEHKSIRDKIYVQTKCGIKSGSYDFSKEHIVSSVEASLKRLKTDYVDTLLLHRPDTLMDVDEVAEAFDKLHSSGKVRNFGVSNHNQWQIELLKTAVKQPILFNQLQISITEAGMITSGMNVNMKNDESFLHDGGLLEYTRINKMTMQAWSPFQYGFFEGTFLNNEKFPELNKKLEELAEKYGVEPAAIAAAWLLRHPVNMQVIAGTANPRHLNEICHGADIILTHDEWYEVYNAAGHCLP